MKQKYPEGIDDWDELEKNIKQDYCTQVCNFYGNLSAQIMEMNNVLPNKLKKEE